MVSVKAVLIVWFLYSFICTFLCNVFDNDTLIGFLAVGPVGWILTIVLMPLYKIQKYFKYHYKKMSIWDDGHGNLYRAKPGMYNDISHCNLSKGYKLMKRYATKSEWKNLPMFSDEFLKTCLVNCNRCVYKKECDKKYDHGNQVLCKTDEFGCIIEYDHYRFNKKSCH